MRDRAPADVLVARTYLAAHMIDHRYLATTVELDANGVPFKTGGRQPTVMGWKEAFSGVQHQEEEENKAGGGEDDGEIPETRLPPVKDGETGQVTNVAIESKKTQPPKRFTEKSLLKAMKNVAQYVDDAAAKKRLKQTSGIGTPATRAGIIETLKDREYIKLVKRQIQPTDTGMSVIDAMEAACPAYCDPAETAAWEDVLKDISANKANVGQFVASIAEKVKRDVLTLRTKENLPQITGGDAGGRPAARAGGGRGGASDAA